MKSKIFLKNLNDIVAKPTEDSRWRHLDFGPKVEQKTIAAAEKTGVIFPDFYKSFVAEFGPVQMQECDDDNFSPSGADFRMFTPQEAVDVTDGEKAGWALSDNEDAQNLVEEVVFFQTYLRHDQLYGYRASTDEFVLFDVGDGTGDYKIFAGEEEFVAALLARIKKFQDG